MQLIMFLLLALGATVMLTLFPEVADQNVHIEAFGWIFETKQGAFVIALLVLFFALWLVRNLASAMLAGPGQIWATLRLGSHRRRETRLREALGQWVNMRGDLGAKTLKRARGVLPDWALDMLKALATPAKDQPLPEKDGDPLVKAMAARIATDPGSYPQPDLATRKAHLEGWLTAYPNSPLATFRLLDIAEEEKDWARAVTLMEQIQRQGFRSPHRLQPRMAAGYLHLANQQPEQAVSNLRKAFRLCPDNAVIVLQLGRGLIRKDEKREALRIWYNHLEKHEDFEVAASLLEAESGDAIQAYKRLERKDRLNTAASWLKAELAYAAKLTGLAEEQMRELCAQHPCRQAWQSLGRWYMEGGNFAKAADCFRQASELPQQDSTEAAE